MTASVGSTTAASPSGDVVDRMHALDIVYERCSIRSYAPTLVSDRQIRRMIDAAVHAPTAMHQEPWRFVVIQDRRVLRRISDRAKAMAAANAMRHGNLLKPPGAPGDGMTSPLADPEFNIFYDAGTLVVICAEATNEFVAADCWLAAQNLMLAATAEGLGSCCIGFAIQALNDADLKKELSIPEELRVYAPIIVGEANEQPLPAPRRAPVVARWIRS